MNANTPSPEVETSRNAIVEKFKDLPVQIAKAFARTYRLGATDHPSAFGRAEGLSGVTTETSPSYDQGMVNDLEQAGYLGLLAAACKKGDSLTAEYAKLAIRNAIIRELKKENRHKVRQEENEESSGTTPLVPSPDSSPEFPIDREELDLVRRKLLPLEQKVVRLRFDENLTVRQVAFVLKIDKSKVNRLEQSAIQRLREMFGVNSDNERQDPIPIDKNRVVAGRITTEHEAVKDRMAA